MLSNLLSLLMSSSFLMLRLGGGSFPRPLKAEEERQYLDRAARGDEEARSILIEHNLRLVAHIIKNRESEGKRGASTFAFSSLQRRTTRPEPSLQHRTRQVSPVFRVTSRERQTAVLSFSTVTRSTTAAASVVRMDGAKASSR